MMSDKWKFQIRFGLAWALVINILTVLYDLQWRTLREQLHSEKLLINIVLGLTIGILVLGHIVWKQKTKKPDKL